MKKLASVISLFLICSMALTACGNSNSNNNNSNNSNNSSASQSASQSAGDEGYTYRTSADNKVVTENGTFTKDNITGPVLITSIGQSADVSMLDALMKKTGAEYTFNATATAEEVANYGTVVIACGASSKGLGAAGISEDEETARANEIVDKLKETGATVIVAHLGGAARRGTMSDKFNDIALSCADYILVVEEGNEDGKFTDIATERGIPVTLLNTIADTMTPLTELFGA